MGEIELLPEAGSRHLFNPEQNFREEYDKIKYCSENI